MAHHHDSQSGHADLIRRCKGPDPPVLVPARIFSLQPLQCPGLQTGVLFDLLPHLFPNGAQCVFANMPVSDVRVILLAGLGDGSTPQIPMPGRFHAGFPKGHVSSARAPLRSPRLRNASTASSERQRSDSGAEPSFTVTFIVRPSPSIATIRSPPTPSWVKPNRITREGPWSAAAAGEPSSICWIRSPPDSGRSS